MFTLAKGAVTAVSVLAVAVAGIVTVLPGHLGLTGSGPAVSPVAATAKLGGGHGGRHHHHRHGGTGSAGPGAAGSSAGGSGTTSSGAGGSGAGTSTVSSGGTGSGGTQPGDPQAGKSNQPVNHGLLHTLVPIHTPVFWNLPVVTALPSPSGTIGDPGVPCLMGYVWRQAYSGDYVCVTPDQRSQAAADNAAATSRVQSGGGAYGQYTCQQGYVWRQVVSDDYVCVTPDERSQAAADNAQAGNRVALLRLWTSDWTPPQQGNNCSGDVCSTTEGGWDGPNFQINGDHFNLGLVLLQIRSNDGTVLWSGTVNAGSWSGYAGGSFGAQTDIGDCSQVPNTSNNDYAIAFDTVSGRWSNELPLDSDCASL